MNGRLANPVGEILIAACLAVANIEQSAPHNLLKDRPRKIERQLEIVSLAREILAKLNFRLRQNGMAAGFARCIQRYACRIVLFPLSGPGRSPPA